jgi:hypothetical protein
VRTKSSDGKKHGGRKKPTHAIEPNSGRDGITEVPRGKKTKGNANNKPPTGNGKTAEHGHDRDAKQFDVVTATIAILIANPRKHEHEEVQRLTAERRCHSEAEKNGIHVRSRAQKEYVNPTRPTPSHTIPTE